MLVLWHARAVQCITGQTDRIRFSSSVLLDARRLHTSRVYLKSVGADRCKGAFICVESSYECVA